MMVGKLVDHKAEMKVSMMVALKAVQMDVI